MFGEEFCTQPVFAQDAELLAPVKNPMARTLRAEPSRCGCHPLAVRRSAPAIQRITGQNPSMIPPGSFPVFAGDPQRVMVPSFLGHDVVAPK